MSDISNNTVETTKMEEDIESNQETNVKANETLNSSKESEGENVEAIKKFIEEQVQDILDQKNVSEDQKNISEDQKNISDHKNVLEDEKNVSEENKLEIIESTYRKPDQNPEEGNIVQEKSDNVEMEPPNETMAIASSVMDKILSESEEKIAKKCISRVPKQIFSPGEKGTGNNSMALSVGSKVEAKDFGEDWYPAQIVEVDYEEMEVLVHYENVSKKHDEWISVSSPRLRPIGTSSKPVSPIPESVSVETAPVTVVKEEPKLEEKPKLSFVVGERCLARWRDNRRFVATISNDLGNGKYEIMFDDGVLWTCATSRLHKLKEPTRTSLTVDTTDSPSAASTPSPDYGPGPSNAVLPPASLPIFHTHLFDPTRDYLGSKSERREMKRKLNIKEIFNIGQKKKKVETLPKERPPPSPRTRPRIIRERKPKVVKNKPILEPNSAVQVKIEVKKEIPDAVASIIGTVTKDETIKTYIKEEVKEEVKEDEQVIEIKEEDLDDSKVDIEDSLDLANSETLSAPESQDMRHEDDPALYEEVKLEKFEQPEEGKHEEVIDRIKEVITKLEDGLNEVDNKVVKTHSPALEIKEEIKSEVLTPSVSLDEAKTNEKPKKNLSKVKKGKKLRLLQEKKVKKQVEKVQCELEEMKRQVEEMRLQMLLKTEQLAKAKTAEMPESFLLPGEWCAKWVNGQPVGKVSEMECEPKIDANNKPILPRRSVQVEDKRLPPGWTKHMVRRSFGHSAGKWDVVLISPDNKRFHTKTDMRNYLELNPDEVLKAHETGLTDFGIHLKLSRRMGWYTTTPDGEQDSPSLLLPAGTLISTSPLVKRKSLSLNKLKEKKKKKLRMKLRVPREFRYQPPPAADSALAGTSANLALDPSVAPNETPPNYPPLEDGYVYVGSLKVQIIENLLRCPAEGCLKNFRNNTLLKMHIKHYHRELRKMLGATPQVLDLAYARTRPTANEMTRLKLEAVQKTVKIKLPRLPKRLVEPKLEVNEVPADIYADPLTVKPEVEKIPRSLDSPKLRNALVNKSVRRPKVLLPVRRPEPVETVPEIKEENIEFEAKPTEPLVEVPVLEPLDFETAISTHTVTKPLEIKRKSDKKKKSFASISKKTASEDDEWFALDNSDVETRSSYPRSGTPDSKIMEQKLVSSESNEDAKDDNMYTYTETGERIKIVHMKREEIINCHCGFREEDGLMVQCELCLCWQHALCHNIQRESEVPEKYTCSICLNPRRGRRSQRFLHDQDRLYEGLLPGAKPCESLRRSHELSGNLLRIEDALHALRVKYYVATKKDHPKLYLWAKDWETGEINMMQEKLNSDYSDLNIMISSIGKENLPIKPEDMKDMTMDIRTPPSEDQEAERFSQRDPQLGSQSLLSGLLSSPGGASIDLPISTSELERLAKSVQEQEPQHVSVTAPQPEAAIENSACRERLLRHIQRCQALIDARLDSIEAQVAELESQDPSLEDDETADYFPRTKQTVQMLMRDLETMEELGVIT